MKNTKYPDFNPAVHIELLASKTALGLIVLVHTLFLATSLTYFSYPLICVIFTLAHLLYSLFQTGWLPFSNPMTEIEISHTQKMSVVFKRKSNNFADIQILDSTVITRFVSILHLQINQQKKYLIVFPDSTKNRDHYRKLIVYAKWHKSHLEPNHSSIFEG